MGKADDLGIDGLSIGVSSKGMESYKKEIKANLLENVKEKIDDVSDLETAINSMWQGKSRDHFLDDFENARKAIKEDLKAEYADLEARLEELEANYYNQDNNLYEGLGE